MSLLSNWLIFFSQNCDKVLFLRKLLKISLCCLDKTTDRGMKKPIGVLEYIPLELYFEGEKVIGRCEMRYICCRHIAYVNVVIDMRKRKVETETLKKRYMWSHLAPNAIQ